MNKIKRFFISAVCAILSLAAHAGMIYDFKYTFNDNSVVSGSFEGIATGNLISGLSNISVSFNGQSFTGSGGLSSGGLYASCFSPFSGWDVDCGVVSFNGLENNFLFSDANFPAPGANMSNYFLIFPATPSYSLGELFFSGAVIAEYPDSDFGLYNPSHWSVTIHDTTSVPEPATLLLFLLGLAGLWFSQRRKISGVPIFQIKGRD